MAFLFMTFYDMFHLLQSNFTDPHIRCKEWTDEECELFESG